MADNISPWHLNNITNTVKASTPAQELTALKYGMYSIDS